MHLSAKVEYACIALLELASRYEKREPVRLRTIAEAHRIPSPFLVQILQRLKSAGLVESTRGAAGGYQLTRDPAEITLAEIKDVIEGTAGNEIVSNLLAETALSRVSLDAWNQVHTAERQLLSEITLGELVERLPGRAERMYYI